MRRIRRKMGTKIRRIVTPARTTRRLFLFRFTPKPNIDNICKI